MILTPPWAGRSGERLVLQLNGGGVKTALEARLPFIDDIVAALRLMHFKFVGFLRH
jgi:hypothetical protein